MASKRVMYRPAPQENVGQRRNRHVIFESRFFFIYLVPHREQYFHLLIAGKDIVVHKSSVEHK